MKIVKKEGTVITMDVSEKEYNFLRRSIGGFKINIPKQGWSTYAGTDVETVLSVSSNFAEEADKFSIPM